MMDASRVTTLNREIIEKKLKVYGDILFEIYESFYQIKGQTILVDFRKDLETLSTVFNSQSDRVIADLLPYLTIEAFKLSNYFYWCEYTAISNQFKKLGTFLKEVEEWYRQIQHSENPMEEINNAYDYTLFKGENDE